MVGDLRDYAQALTRHTNGYMTHANRPMESPSRMSAAVNARHLNEVPERDLGRLADLLEEAAMAYLAAAAAADETAAISDAQRAGDQSADDDQPAAGRTGRPRPGYRAGGEDSAGTSTATTR